MEQRGWYQSLEDILWLTQLGFSMMLPLVLCMGLCWWLTTAKGVGGWVWIPGFLVGFAAGAGSFRSFARTMQKRADKAVKQAPPRFNQH